MLRKMKMDPLRIHNYNKFLITLDKTTVTKTEVTKTETTNVEKPKEQESTLEEQIKNKLDTINGRGRDQLWLSKPMVVR